MAVLRFKQHIGYYVSLEPAGFSMYSLFTDTIATRTAIVTAVEQLTAEFSENFSNPDASQCSVCVDPIQHNRSPVLL